MSLVAWIGKPDHWTPPDTHAEGAQWVLAAEEDMLPFVALIMPDGKRRISPLAALRCVDRCLLRHTLAPAYNPEWSSFHYSSRIVVKAPASSGSSGVRILDLETPENDVVRALRAAVGLSDTLMGVIEEFVEGDAIELSGVKLAGKVFFFHPLRQHWTPDFSRIERYERVYGYWWLYKETAKALRRIGLDESAFCVEWRVIGCQQAKLIEINPRLGDDKDYFKYLWDRPVWEQIEEWSQEVYQTESPETAQAVAAAIHA